MNASGGGTRSKQFVTELQTALYNWHADPSPDAFAKLFWAAGCVAGVVCALELELEQLTAATLERELFQAERGNGAPRPGCTCARPPCTCWPCTCRPKRAEL